MAKSNSKKKILKSAQRAANSSTLNAVARNAQRGAASKSAQKSTSTSKTTSSSKAVASKKADKKASKTKAAKKPASAGILKKTAGKKSASTKNTSTKKTPAKDEKAKTAQQTGAKTQAKTKESKKYSAAKAQKLQDKSSNAKKKGAQDMGSKQEAQEKHKKGPKRMGAARRALVISLVAVVIIIGCCCAAFAAVESERSQYVPEMTMLDGQTDVSGMTVAELRELLTQRVENNIGTTITLSIGEATHQIRLDDIGTIDIEATVEQAFEPYRENPALRFITVLGEFFTGEPKQYDICTMCIVNPQALSAQVEKIAENTGAEPKDAGYAYDAASNGLVVTQAKQGVLMDVEATIAVIEAALEAPDNGDPKRLLIQAEGSIADPEHLEPGQAIFVDTAGCHVYLYENGTVVETFACTPGTSGYATPTGDFTLSYKDGAPTWYNPHSAWSESMPETIPPGPSNPLGERALAVSCGDGIYIHGTTSTGALGSPGSHGCVRLSNADIIRLYDRVSQGIPIIIR